MGKNHASQYANFGSLPTSLLNLFLKRLANRLLRYLPEETYQMKTLIKMANHN